MKELVRDLESLHLRDIKTYIQSGNAVFRSSRAVWATLGAQLATRIEQRHAFGPHVLILSADQWRAAIESNPIAR